MPDSSVPPAARTPTIFVVSDGRGQTGAAVLQAALVQFEGQPCAIVREANVRTRERVEEVVVAAARSKAIVFYTLVADETRRAMQDAAARSAVPVVDVLGPALSALHDLFQRDPRAEPGLLHTADRETAERLEAIDFTLKHDDGRRPDELGHADVVLVGVSRSGKSSTCFYLAYDGVKAANVPLLPNVPVPPELLELPRDRVIGLWVNASRLLVMRQARARNLGVGAGGAYTDHDAVKEELRATNRTMGRCGWRTIDASYMAVEEIAREVMRLRGIAVRNPG